jgi:hypothetical protein
MDENAILNAQCKDSSTNEPHSRYIGSSSGSFQALLNVWPARERVGKGSLACRGSDYEPIACTVTEYMWKH